MSQTNLEKLDACGQIDSTPTRINIMLEVLRDLVLANENVRRGVSCEPALAAPAEVATDEVEARRYATSFGEKINSASGLERVQLRTESFRMGCQHVRQLLPALEEKWKREGAEQAKTSNRKAVAKGWTAYLELFFDWYEELPDFPDETSGICKEDFEPELKKLHKALSKQQEQSNVNK